MKGVPHKDRREPLSLHVDGQCRAKDGGERVAIGQKSRGRGCTWPCWAAGLNLVAPASPRLDPTAVTTNTTHRASTMPPISIKMLSIISLLAH